MQPLAGFLASHRQLYGPVVRFDASRDRIIALDLSESNRELDAGIFGDTVRFSEYISGKLIAGHAKFGIGGYGEKRALYARSAIFGSDRYGEPRRLHLGIDIWGAPYTPVLAPLDGIVHSFAMNDQPGDYGATLILTHGINRRFFYSLYGHLSRNSISNCKIGATVRKGDTIGEFGIPLENGRWPPHLHFQLINDMGGGAGDYPGVCRWSEKDSYLLNCPDPEIVLQLNRYLR